MEATTAVATIAGLSVGIIAGMALMAYVPRLGKTTAWFTVDGSSRLRVLKTFGKYMGFSMVILDNEVLVTISLVKWLDFDRSCAQSYLDGFLKTLHEKGLQETGSGVY